MVAEYCYPTARENLGDYYEMTWRCAKCGFCRNVFPSDTEHERFGRQCPSGEKYRFESYYASGRNELARRTIEGSQQYSERLRHILYTCTTCGACEEWCQATQGLYPLKTTMAMRKHFCDQGYPLHPAHARLVQRVAETANRLGRNNRDRRGWLAEHSRISAAPTEGAIDFVYFVGCRSSFRHSQIAWSTYELLSRKLGYQVGFLQEERCCGLPSLEVGNEGQAGEMLRHNVQQIKESGAEKVLFSCPECFHMFSQVEKFGITQCFEPIHLSQLLFEERNRLSKMISPSTKTEKSRVTFHDPCYLGRHHGILEQPRELLAMFADLELVELPRNRKNSWCCGAGGCVAEAFPELAQSTAQERIEEVRHVDAQLLISGCPGCKENLLGGCLSSGIEILDLAELINHRIRG